MIKHTAQLQEGAILTKYSMGGDIEMWQSPVTTESNTLSTVTEYYVYNK